MDTQKTNKPKFKIGDRVRVRQWKDMADEFGFYFHDTNSIAVPFAFTDRMESLCGQTAVVEAVIRNEHVPFVEPGNCVYELRCKWDGTVGWMARDKAIGRQFLLSEEMFEPAPTEEPRE